ncbi:sensor histidine kinase [Desulfovibrio inopinatus]|uniref:sensor histidine kinase n=1 Tax=Desulfovibrio inopinatus TaxID=102109 RepID=UPI000558FF46|nr:PAS domain-containing sensor histidine kinase [Desulfovibrio inopinatus]
MWSDNKYSRLRWKIIGGTMAFSLIPLLVAGFFATHTFQRAFNATVTKNLETMVGDKRRALDMFLEERVAQLKTLLMTHSPEELGDKASLEKLFNAMQSSSESFVDVGFIGQEGHHLAYVGPYNLENVNYSGTMWFQQTLLKGIYISNVFLGYRKFPHFVIAVSQLENGKTWILRATIDSDVFDRLVRAVQVGKRGDAFLLDSENRLQTASRFQGKVLGLSSLPPAMPFHGIHIDTAMVDGSPMFIGTAWLESVRWRLVILEDPAEEMSALFRTRSLLWLVGLVGMLVIATGATIMAKSIVSKLIESDSEKAALDASLMQSSKMAALGKLAAGVAHEINNPLALIREGAGWLKDLLAEESSEAMLNYEEFDRSLDLIELHVDRARDVTHRMLGFGRRMEPAQEHVDLNSLVDQTIRFLQQEAIHRNIAIHTDFAQDLPRLTTDPNQLQQVILNIADNALDAVGRDGEIHLKSGVLPSNTEIFLEVKDSGPGMSKAVLEHLFEPFYTTKVVGEGTGLGLSICFTIMEKLGGRIEVDSTVGQGSTFTLILPLARL